MRAGTAGWNWCRTVEEAATEADAGVQRAIAYLNDQVVPEIRREGSHALRVTAGWLLHLARHVDAGGSAGTRSAGHP